MGAFSIASIAVLFGFAASLMKAVDIAMWFGGCLLPCWVAFFVCTYMLAVYENTALMPREKFCDFSIMPELLHEYSVTIDKDVNKVSNKWMCSRQCPCDMIEV
jgi:hypothetical protein